MVKAKLKRHGRFRYVKKEKQFDVFESQGRVARDKAGEKQAESRM